MKTKSEEAFLICLLYHNLKVGEENRELAVELELSEKVNKQNEVINEARGGLPVWA